MHRYLLATVVGMWSACSPASNETEKSHPGASGTPGTYVHIGLENPVVIDQIITRGTMEPVLKYLSDGVIGNNLPTDITLVINSPGGEIGTGYKFVHLMREAQSQGIKFHCIVPQFAASMAFQILLQCDTRVALDGAMLLWHRARVMPQGEPMTGPMAQNLGEELQETDELILREVRAGLSQDMSDERIVFHFEHETLHEASGLASKAPSFLNSVRTVDGLTELLVNTTVVRTIAPPPSIFGFLRPKAQDHEIVYIWNKFIPQYMGGFRANQN